MTRKRLPNRRGGENLSFESRGQRIDATVGYNNGNLYECFLRCGKAGTDLSVSMIELGVAVSLALQYGCPPSVIRAAMPEREDKTPEGAIGQLLDLLAKPRLEPVT